MHSRKYLYIIEDMHRPGMKLFKYLSYAETLQYLLWARQTARRKEVDSLELGDSIELFNELSTVTLMRYE